MVVLKHNRRQTGLLVVCLFMVTGEVLRMMDCGKQAAKLTIPVLLVFAFLLSRSGEAEQHNSATAFDNSNWLWPVSGQFQCFGNTGNSGTAGVPLVLTLDIAASSGAMKNATHTRKRRGSALPQRLAIILFSSLGRNFI
jgi:hypothetical protein